MAFNAKNARAVDMLPVAVHAFVLGVQIAAVLTGPRELFPPATNTCPSWRRTAPWECTVAGMVPALLHVPDVGL